MVRKENLIDLTNKRVRSSAKTVILRSIFSKIS